MKPVDNHRLVAGRFQRLVDGTRDWRAPTPVAEWVAGDVVRHLLEWFPPFLRAASDLVLPGSSTPSDAELSTAWRRRTRAIQQLLENTTPPKFDHPRIGPMPFDEAVDRFYTADVFMHSWDLARSSGQDDTLDPEVCAAMLAGMEPIEDVIRSSGHYGARIEVPPDARAQDRLIGFIGRDPNWRPPGT